MRSGLKIAAPVLEKIKALVAAHGSKWQLVQRLWIVLDANHGLRTVTIMAAIGNWPTGRGNVCRGAPGVRDRIRPGGRVDVRTVEPHSDSMATMHVVKDDWYRSALLFGFSKVWLTTMGLSRSR